MESKYGKGHVTRFCFKIHDVRDLETLIYVSLGGPKQRESLSIWIFYRVMWKGGQW